MKQKRIQIEIVSGKVEIIILGKKKLYPIIAKKEYDAADKYKHLLADFPEVESVMNDEVHHGDAVMGLL